MMEHRFVRVVRQHPQQRVQAEVSEEAGGRRQPLVGEIDDTWPSISTRADAIAIFCPISSRKAWRPGLSTLISPSNMAAAGAETRALPAGRRDVAGPGLSRDVPFSSARSMGAAG